MSKKELELEIIRLKSLCYRAAEEIIELDNRLIEVSSLDDTLKEEKDQYGTFTSINLLSRLTGRIKGNYLNCYPELELQKKVVESHYQIENSMFYSLDSSKWYECAHCDAGYPDQECTCPNVSGGCQVNESTHECPKGTHQTLDEALGCWKCQNASQNLNSKKI